MSGENQEELLTKLQNELAELEAERKFMQRQTGHHISRDLRDKYESDVMALRKRIAELEESLSTNS